MNAPSFLPRNPRRLAASAPRRPGRYCPSTSGCRSFRPMELSSLLRPRWPAALLLLVAAVVEWTRTPSLHLVGVAVGCAAGVLLFLGRGGEGAVRPLRAAVVLLVVWLGWQSWRLDRVAH